MCYLAVFSSRVPEFPASARSHSGRSCPKHGPGGLTEETTLNPKEQTLTPHHPKGHKTRINLGRKGHKKQSVMVELSVEQRCSVDQIQQLFESHRVIMLIGAAGTGKSVVVAELLRKWATVGKVRVAITAISHKSLAQHRETVASITADSKKVKPPPFVAVWAKLKIDADWWARVPLGKARKKPSPWYNVAGPKILVVEEYGLWTAEQIATLDATLRATFKARQSPFGGVRVLFVGDEGQIDPRGGERAFQLIPCFEGLLV